MNVVHAGRDVVVIDEVLDPPSFDAIGQALLHGRYDSVHAHGWDKAWRLCDGTPLRGVGVYYDPTRALARPGARYPTSSIVDTFIDVLRALTTQHPQIVGTEGVEWSSIFLSPWLYPVGSALTLHRDGGAYSGAFTYFAHPRWGVHWGGELLILDDELSPAPPRPQGATGWLAEDEIPAGLAMCVFARPNRLVLVGPDRPHLMTRVDVNAGDHVRTTLAGFFLRR